MSRSKERLGERTLFEAAATRDEGAMPLAERVRPRALDEVLGHEEVVGERGVLRQALASDRMPSLILWGPPGSGKTTLARAVAARSQTTFVPFSAVLGGVAEVRKIVAAARDRRRLGQGATTLFVDEIHRFNKAQQDAFLPHVEDGTVSLIGATTENPSFSLNAPLLSRCIVVRLEPLDDDDVAAVLRRALAHPRGYAAQLEASDGAIAVLARSSRGDARRALGLLEAAAARARGAEGLIDEATARDVIGHEPLLYDKTGDEHYDVTSALIKSMRGSDPDAAVYWMMRMVEAGDDPRFVLRRLVIFASEDVGNADPRALQVAVAADQAFARLGMPEGLYAMAQAVTYLACAPKSNAANLAWHRAREAVREHGALPVPKHLRNAPTELSRAQGHGRDYRYPHDEPGGVAAGVTYLPERLAGRRFYEPTERGLEAKIGAFLRRLRGES